MENKLGRKNLAEWLETMQKHTSEMYKQAFYEGYDAAKDETPDIETIAKLITGKYDLNDLYILAIELDRYIDGRAQAKEEALKDKSFPTQTQNTKSR